MRKLTNLSGLFLLTIILASTSFSQVAVDPTFNAVPAKGTIDFPSDKGQVLQPDGKVIVWGGAVAVDGIAKGQIARLNTDGTVDQTFNYCNCHLLVVNSVFVQPDGKILIGGRDKLFMGKVLRLNSDGSLDQGFSAPIPVSGGFLGYSYFTIWAVTSDGKIYVERYDRNSNFTSKNIYRINSNGTLDGTFTPILLSSTSSVYINNITDLKPLPDGKFIYSTTYNQPSNSFPTFVRRNADGSADSSWESPSFTSSNFSDRLRADGFDMFPDGSYIVSGKFSFVNGITKKDFVKILPAGNVDLTFTGPSTYVSGGRPRVLSSGKILTTVETEGVKKFRRLNADGTEDTFRTSNETVKEENEKSSDARIDKAAVAVPDNFAPENSVTSVLNRYEIDANENIVFFGTTTTSGQKYQRLSADGNEDQNFAPAVLEFGYVYSISRRSDGKLVVSGDFLTMNSALKGRVARLNHDGSLDPTFDVGTGFDVAPTIVSAQADGKVLAAGDFNTFNGVAKTRLARLNADGSLDTSFTTSIPTVPKAIALQPDGKILLAGNFLNVNGTAQKSLARLNTDGTLDTGFSPIFGSGASLNFIILSNGDKITVGGDFNGVNGFNRSSMVRLNSDGTLDQTFNSGPIGTVRNGWLQPDAKYVIASNDASNPSVYRRNSDGSADNTFTAPFFRSLNVSQPTIDQVVIQSNGKIIVGGMFDLLNDNIRRYYMVRLNSNGSIDTSYPTETNGLIRTMLMQPNGRVFIGGDFSVAGNAVRSGIARLYADSATKPFDFDGDGKTDISVYRPADGNWFLAQSTAGFAVRHFGLSADLLAPADYDGDGKTDISIFRDGNWWRINSSDNSVAVANWGAAGDIPMPSDFDADGKADFIYFRPSTGQWFRAGSTGAVSNVSFGIAGDIPVIGDFDADGKADPAIFRPSNGVWWYLSSVTGIGTPVQWGMTGDVPVAGDYDGDGKTDMAVWRPSNGAWYVLNSGNGSYSITLWGLAEDKPVVGDYDGDGKSDIAVWRPSTGVWYIMQSTAGFTGMQYGLPADKAVPNAYNP